MSHKRRNLSRTIGSEGLALTTFNLICILPYQTAFWDGNLDKQRFKRGRCENNPRKSYSCYLTIRKGVIWNINDRGCAASRLSPGPAAQGLRRRGRPAGGAGPAMVMSSKAAMPVRVRTKGVQISAPSGSQLRGRDGVVTPAARTSKHSGHAPMVVMTMGQLVGRALRRTANAGPVRDTA